MHISGLKVKNIKRIDTLSDEQVDQLVHMFENEWWTKGRMKSDVLAMLQNCDVIVAMEENCTGKLVAFARILTDYVYRAMIYDVIVSPDHRGQGLGNMLGDEIVHHPELRHVECLSLHCLPSLVPFYNKWQFVTEQSEVLIMHRYQKNSRS